jgi:hypothetical protein
VMIKSTKDPTPSVSSKTVRGHPRNLSAVGKPNACLRPHC